MRRGAYSTITEVRRLHEAAFLKKHHYLLEGRFIMSKQGLTVGFSTALSTAVLTALNVTPLSAHAQAGASALDEVVVTARRREETLQDVPISVSAFSASELDNAQVVSLRDLSFAAPNLMVTNNQTTVNSAAVFIRGVGQDDSTPVQEPGVGIYLDGVYMARSQGALLDLIEFDSIEVLRGPQGTLYGRNSTGGAIKFTTRRPDLLESRFVGDVTVGSFNRLDIRGSASVPVIENTLAVKVDALSFTRDGYLKRITDGRDLNRTNRQAARLSALWAISEQWDLDFSFDYSRDRSGLQTSTPITDEQDRMRSPLFGSPFLTDPLAEDFNEYTGWGSHVTLRGSTPFGEFSSITAYRWFENNFAGDLLGRGGSPASGVGQGIDRELEHRQFSQEFQLLGELGTSLNYVMGLYYLYEKFTNVDFFLFVHDYDQRANSAAAFGEITYSLTDRLNLTAGARLTYDRKEIEMRVVGLFGAFTQDDRRSWTDFSPKLGLDFRLTDTTMVYAQAQKGYKVGAYQGWPQRPNEVTDQVLEPERVWAYEVGLKNQLFDDRVILNLSAFFMDYTDIQLSAINPEIFSFESRTADAEMWGIEADFQIAVTDNLRFQGFAAYFDSEITRSDFPADPLVPPEGSVLPFMPEFMARLGFIYDIPLQNGANLSFGASVAHKSKVFYGPFNEPFNLQDSHQLADAQLTYSSQDDAWEVQFGVKNLTNKAWVYTSNPSGAGAYFYAPPRTWSIQLRTRF